LSEEIEQRTLLEYRARHDLNTSLLCKLDADMNVILTGWLEGNAAR